MASNEKNTENESSWSRRVEKLCLLRHFYLRSFTPSKSTRKVQVVFRPNCFGRFESNIRIGCKLGLLDVNPSLNLAREAQPPLMYLRGDGRLKNNTQSQKPIYKPTSPKFLLLVRRRSSYRRASIHEILGSGEPT